MLQCPLCSAHNAQRVATTKWCAEDSARYSEDYGCPAQVDCVSFLDEKFLARETGTILVFVVGLCRGRPNQLDWRTQLLCPKQPS